MISTFQLKLAVINTVGFSASTVVALWLGSISQHFGMPPWYAVSVVR